MLNSRPLKLLIPGGLLRPLCLTPRHHSQAFALETQTCLQTLWGAGGGAVSSSAAGSERWPEASSPQGALVGSGGLTPWGEAL